MQSEQRKRGCPKSCPKGNSESRETEQSQAHKRTNRAKKTKMANYGRLGPAGALRYCRSVSIDFEEEPSTQETEQRE